MRLQLQCRIEISFLHYPTLKLEPSYLMLGMAERVAAMSGNNRDGTPLRLMRGESTGRFACRQTLSRSPDNTIRGAHGTRTRRRYGYGEITGDCRD